MAWPAPHSYWGGGVLKHHLDTWEERYPEIVTQLRDSMYVDDLISGGTTVGEVKAQKEKTVEIFKDACFTIHKWHPNSPDVEPVNEPPPPESTDLTYAKHQLGCTESAVGKLLGVPWDREQDAISGTLKPDSAPLTKRTTLPKLART